MIALRAQKGSSYVGARWGRISRTSDPPRQEPTPSGTPPGFGFCRVGSEVREILDGSTIEGREGVPPID